MVPVYLVTGATGFDNDNNKEKSKFLLYVNVVVVVVVVVFVVVVVVAAGFVGSWCVKTLLDNGCSVRGTVRDPSAAKCDFLRQLKGAEQRLQLVKADLLDGEEAWRRVVRGCSVVLHTASPFVVEGVPAGEEEDFFVKPAVEGTESVIRACIAERVARVVLTSSVAAIGYGHDGDEGGDPKLAAPGYDERQWSNLDGLTLPQEMYAKSKTLAEMKAWELVKNTSVQLCVVNPGLALGPFLSLDTSSGSLVVLRTLLNKEYPAVPNLPFVCVDVRDVAKMHFLAATSLAAAGKRFLCVSTPVSVSMHEVALSLDAAGFAVPTGRLPDWVMRALALVDAKIAFVSRNVGQTHYTNAINGNELMGGCWIDYKTSIRDQAQSMILA
ncbi:unnamed protein product [Polarella glacialis]|uniref:NAD-dependent epimerase/dehydratase domain-containing protein n=1 Tax=Polarella glacialis TaxID=89957 RepID=A0A813J199_POLGL|nr:unnamed protein product [Polarella glacialis]